MRRAAVLLAVAGLAVVMLPAGAQAPPAAPKKPVTAVEVGRRIGGPTLVTLQFKDAPVRDVYDALARQAGIEWREAEMIWGKRLPPLTVDIKGQPFWTALNTLEEKTGIGLVRWVGEPGYWLGFRRENGSRTLLSGVSDASGPFLLLARQIERAEAYSQPLGTGAAGPQGRSTLQIGLSLFVDPKLRIGRVGSLRLNEAVDDDLQSLVAEGSPRELPIYGSSTIPLEATLGFLLPPRRGRRIARLTGAIRLVALTKSEKWEIPVTGTASPKPVSKVLPDPAGDRSFTLTALRPEGGNSGYDVELEYTVPRTLIADAPFPIEVSDVFAALRLLDAQGRQWRRSGGSVNGGGNGTQMRYRYFGTFVRGSRAVGDAAPGEPAKLIWDIPVEYQEVAVPFEFNDLPIP